jgi:ubiquinone/menaquinone biosynthesis C-methylase UbiE
MRQRKCHICPSWLSFILYNPFRKAFTSRAGILDESCITADSVVLEVGAGNGFITEAVASRAKKVIAVEVQEGMVSKLRRRIQKYEGKVEIISGDIASVNLHAEHADVCIMYYSFHEVGKKEIAALCISNSLKKHGILSIYEPTIEVSKADMLDTVSIFERLGFAMQRQRQGRFTRFVLMRKIGKAR